MGNEVLTLEAALATIAADNGLTSIAVGRRPVGERVVYTALVHYDGFAADGIPCEQGLSDVSIVDAIAQALDKAATNRAPVAVAPETVPALGIAA